ncbi:hypothetical protein CYMTET_10948 [Cymbomonas tetramitiformis]|uniref:Uncharacterized protein n=1 Tax=Cymbomonas tetramitiformis TaxID=36881 RepID=A0AAE0LDN1_9CHLO|nr:hypothetical protein CYMTET_10948 [Cymbomonas tetramitiformis]
MDRNATNARKSPRPAPRKPDWFKQNAFPTGTIPINEAYTSIATQGPAVTDLGKSASSAWPTHLTSSKCAPRPENREGFESVGPSFGGSMRREGSMRQEPEVKPVSSGVPAWRAHDLFSGTIHGIGASKEKLSATPLSPWSPVATPSARLPLTSTTWQAAAPPRPAHGVTWDVSQSSQASIAPSGPWDSLLSQMATARQGSRPGRANREATGGFPESSAAGIGAARMDCLGVGSAAAESEGTSGDFPSAGGGMAGSGVGGAEGALEEVRGALALSHIYASPEHLPRASRTSCTAQSLRRECLQITELIQTLYTRLEEELLAGGEGAGPADGISEEQAPRRWEPQAAREELSEGEGLSGGMPIGSQGAKEEVRSSRKMEDFSPLLERVESEVGRILLHGSMGAGSRDGHDGGTRFKVAATMSDRGGRGSPPIQAESQVADSKREERIEWLRKSIADIAGNRM